MEAKSDMQAVQMPWVEKYRPEKLEDLVAQDDIVASITSLIDSGNLPHLLLYGPPGTGKTSTIVAAAKRMYGSTKAYNSMTLELNASDARGIDVVRNEIKEFAGTQQLFLKGIKLIILDEADAMTSDAQFALRRIMEKYSKNCRFCLICNYVSKIIPALQSRCTRFRFSPLASNQIQGRLEHVAMNEHCPTTPDGIQAILRLSGGDMRRVLNLLQATAMSHHDRPVDETAVYLTSGAPLPNDIDRILEWLMNHDFAAAFRDIHYLCTTKGYALTDVLQDLTDKILCLDMDSVPLGLLLDGMSAVEHRLALGTDERIQLASLVGVFVQTRQSLQVL
ncbi:replication factor C subunit 3/5 [Fistulifera solaris]|uniref:Replication factor C subunit 3/5 n=1 Tax=Fistulifera solaris TaxID=1519565 RepID=A0A1Z5KAF4_FISSO|nr:replication factor C subunit 3/5 [Fistulifera solaris]|eukprot:GAX23135.1 replication factor C subunit 3/5 [Fistulifera solaris]